MNSCERRVIKKGVGGEAQGHTRDSQLKRKNSNLGLKKPKSQGVKNAFRLATPKRGGFIRGGGGGTSRILRRENAKTGDTAISKAMVEIAMREDGEGENYQ